MLQCITSIEKGEEKVVCRDGIKCYLPNVEVYGNTIQKKYNNENLLNPDVSLTAPILMSYRGVDIKQYRGKELVLSVSLKDDSISIQGVTFGIIYKKTNESSTSAKWLIFKGQIKGNYDEDTKSYYVHVPADESRSLAHFYIGLYPETPYTFATSYKAWNALFQAYNIMIEIKTTKPFDKPSQYKEYKADNYEDGPSLDSPATIVNSGSTGITIKLVDLSKVAVSMYNLLDSKFEFSNASDTGKMNITQGEHFLQLTNIATKDTDEVYVNTLNLLELYMLFKNKS